MEFMTKPKVANLIEIIKANKAKHRQIFEEAIEGYRKRAVAEVDRMLEDLKAGRTNIDLAVRLPRPEDHTRDYNRVLKMLEMHQEETILIDQQTFAQFVLDDWHWKRAFVTTSAAYVGPELRLYLSEEAEDND